MGYSRNLTSFQLRIASGMPTKYNFISRRLSNYETVLDLLNRHGDGILCHVMILKSRRQISIDVIRNAFKWLVHYQPALRMCVATETGPHGLVKRFVERKNIRDLDVTQVYPHNENWNILLEGECAELMNSEVGPLWKVLFMEMSKTVFMDMHNGDTIRTYAVVFKASHVIADHISIHNMLSKQLMALLEQSPDLERLDEFRTPLFMAPSVDLSFSPACKTLSDAIPACQTKKKSKRKSSGKADNPVLGLSQEFSFVAENNETDGPTQTRVFVNAITGSNTDCLLRLCRKHSVTPQEALTVAAMYAFYLTTRAKKLPIDGTGIRICHWLDLRNFHSASHQGDPLGMWLCPVFTKHKIPKRQPTTSRFWSQVKKLAATLRPEEEPWKRTFREYQSIVDEISKTDSEELGDLSVPKAHVAVSFLNARGQGFNGTIPRSKHESVTPSSTTSRLSSRSDDTALTSPRDSSRLLAIEEYHVTSAAAPHSVSSLNLSVVLNQSSASCSLAVDGSKVPRKFAESFLGIFCRVVTNMVASHSKSRHSSVIEKLPPYVRARIMTKTPGSSKI